MKRLIPSALIFAAALIGGHYAALHMIPKLIMNKAMERMEARGITQHSFTLVPHSTPQTQSVVRPSPDLAYSICLFDLSDDQELIVHASPYQDYASVSFFDAHTNNFATIRVDSKEHKNSGSQILLRRQRLDKTVNSAFDGPQIQTPTQRGIILIRRLAPTPAAYEKVRLIAPSDHCSLVAN